MKPEGGPLLVVTDRQFWRRSIGSEQRVASLVEHLASRGERVIVAYLGRVSTGEREALDRFCELSPRLEVRSRAGGLAAFLPGMLAAGRAIVSATLRAAPRRAMADNPNPLLRATVAMARSTKSVRS